MRDDGELPHCPCGLAKLARRRRGRGGPNALGHPYKGVGSSAIRPRLPPSLPGHPVRGVNLHGDGRHRALRTRRKKGKTPGVAAPPVDQPDPVAYTPSQSWRCRQSRGLVGPASLTAKSGHKYGKAPARAARGGNGRPRHSSPRPHHQAPEASIGRAWPRHAGHDWTSAASTGGKRAHWAQQQHQSAAALRR